jgi:hypothetical protein
MPKVRAPCLLPRTTPNRTAHADPCPALEIVCCESATCWPSEAQAASCHPPCCPPMQALSNLSPYLHYGQLAPQRAAIEAAKHRAKYKVWWHPALPRPANQLLAQRACPPSATPPTQPPTRSPARLPPISHSPHTAPHQKPSAPAPHQPLPTHSPSPRAQRACPHSIPSAPARPPPPLSSAACPTPSPRPFPQAPPPRPPWDAPRRRRWRASWRSWWCGAS